MPGAYLCGAAPGGRADGGGKEEAAARGGAVWRLFICLFILNI